MIEVNPFAVIIKKLEEIEKRIDSIDSQPYIEKPIGIEEAAEFYNTSVASIYAKVHRNQIPFSKNGKKLLFFKSKLAECLEPKLTRDQIKDRAVNHGYMK